MTSLTDLHFHAEGPAVTVRTLAGATTSRQVLAGAWGVMSPSMPTHPPAASLSPANLEGFFESHLKDWLLGISIHVQETWHDLRS